MPWKEVKEFEDGEFNGFVAISNRNGQKYIRIWKRKLKIKKRKKESLKENTEQWVVANNEQVDRNEELRLQFELGNLYKELKERIEDWEEDRQWEAQEELKRREEVEEERHTILEMGNLDIKEVNI